jgi:hypothetical protein
MTETQRVVSLPDENLEGVDLTEELKTHTGSMILRPIQSEALHAIRRNNGGFFPIGVGHGKSLIGLLAGTVLKSKLTLVLTPASTVGTLRRTYAETRLHFKMTSVRVQSYEMFSSPKGANLLREILDGYKPEEVVIVCDEAHRLKAMRSVRTRRLLRYLRENPKIKIVAMSGTMTAKGLEDFKHLAEICLRERSPVPRDRRHFGIWQACIDVDGRANRDAWQVIQPLWNRHTGDDSSPLHVRGSKRQEIIRQAFQSRLRSAPGVVASKAGALGCSLRITQIKHYLPIKVLSLLEALEEHGELPDGDVAADDIAVWRAHRQLSQGFYLRWHWPNNQPDNAWLDARRRWNQCLRREIETNEREGYDSGFLVACHIERELAAGNVRRPREIHKAWQAWQWQKEKAIPPTVPVWIDKGLINASVKWLTEQTEPSILWYEHQTVGDQLEAHGVKVYRAGDEPRNDGRPCAMSIAAHGIGKNLQSWSNQLIMCPPSSGHVWEQLLGRTHRPGQEADEVSVHVYTHTDRFLGAVKNAIEDAKYIESSTGNAQKILFADHTF